MVILLLILMKLLTRIFNDNSVFHNYVEFDSNGILHVFVLPKQHSMRFNMPFFLLDFAPCKLLATFELGPLACIFRNSRGWLMYK